MRVWLIISFLFTGLSFIAEAQVFSNDGRFSVPQAKGCAPYSFVVTAPECTGTFGCSIRYGDGRPDANFATGQTVTYPVAGNFTMTIIFSIIAGNPDNIDEINIVVSPNIQPQFDIYTCGSNRIQLRVTDTNYQQYAVDFGDGSPQPNVVSNSTISYTYAAPGTYSVSVRGRNLNSADNCNSMVKSVVVGQVPQPQLTRLDVNDNVSITLTAATDPNVQYRLERAINNGTTFQQIQTFATQQTSLTINNLNTDDQYYCFRLGAHDPCSNTTIYSNVICSINFDVTPENNNNRLQWLTYLPGITGFEVHRDPGGITPVGNTTSTHNDGLVQCGFEYSYQIVSNYAGARSYSQVKTVTAISNDIPTTINNVATMVHEGGVTLEWKTDPTFVPKLYEIFRSPAEDFSNVYGTSTVESFTDNTYTNQARFCYKIRYEDICNNKSELSNKVCPIQLTAAVSPTNTITLGWQGYNGWLNGVDRYEVEKYDASGGFVATTPVGAATTYTDTNDDPVNQVQMYRVIAYPNDLSLDMVSVSNIVTIIKNINLSHPAAFVPNSNLEANKTFRVYGYSSYFTRYELKIYNRWGEMMFDSQDPETAWDGTFRGNQMPEGTYVFKAIVSDQAGRTFDYAGTVVLLKK